MNVTLKITLPFHSFTFRNEFDDSPIEVKFRGIDYKLSSIDFNEEKNSTLAIIEWEQDDRLYTQNEEGHHRLVEKVIDFINFVIYHARTFDIETTNMVLVSPRTVRTVSLSLKSELQEFSFEIALVNKPPEFFKEYFEYINEPGSFDSFYSMIQESEDESIQLLEINLLVDAYHALFESRYSEAVINCLTAIETHIFPILSSWLAERFFNKNEKTAETVLIDMNSATKFELLFGTVAAEYLSTEAKLLEDLKGINKLRNEIIHKGKRASKKEANSCLNVASKLILILHFKIEPPTK